MESVDTIKATHFFILPCAQDAFDQAMAKLDSIDIEPLMPAIADRIKNSIAIGGMGTMLGPFEALIAEKISIELVSKYGYSAQTMNAGISEKNIPLSTILVVWRYFIANQRERLN